MRFFILALFLVGSAGASEWFVAVDDTGDFPTIQSALDGIADGDTITLRSGYYRGSDNTVLIAPNKGFLLRSSEEAPFAQLLGSTGIQAGIYFGPGYSSSAVIQNITFGYGESTCDGDSGSMSINGGSPQFIECTFFSNEAPNGGAAFVSGTATPVFDNCMFDRNHAVCTGTLYGQGGAASITDNAVATFDCCTFKGNHADGLGDSIYCTEDASITISDCIFGSAPSDSTIDGSCLDSLSSFRVCCDSNSNCTLTSEDVCEALEGQWYPYIDNCDNPNICLNQLRPASWGQIKKLYH